MTKNEYKRYCEDWDVDNHFDEGDSAACVETHLRQEESLVEMLKNRAPAGETRKKLEVHVV